MATPAKQHSYTNIFEEKLPSRFPTPTLKTLELKTCTCEADTTLGVPLRKKVKYFFVNVWHSRIAMKLFGSQKELELEEERLKSIDYLVIHPCSKFRYVVSHSV